MRIDDDATTMLQAGDTLNDLQTLRLSEALAVLRAKKAALASGVAAEQLDDYSWVVDVDPLDTEPG